MVKLRRKKEEIYLADFKKVSVRDFMTTKQNCEGMAYMLSKDGRIAINKDNALSHVVYAVFVALSKSPPEALIELREKYMKKYPNICDFDDLEKKIGFIQAEMIPYIMGALLVPIEFDRREVRRLYCEK